MFHYFKINTVKIAQEIIDGEVIIINLDDGCYYSLLSTGAEIWQDIEKGLSHYEIIQDMVNRYEGVAEDIKEAVETLINQLLEEEIILSDSPFEKIQVSELKISSKEEKEKLRFKAPKLQKYTDMQDLLTLDPIHDVDETGWPNRK